MKLGKRFDIESIISTETVIFCRSMTKFLDDIKNKPKIYEKMGVINNLKKLKL